MAKIMTFFKFEETHGKVIVRPYNIGGNYWKALLCQDEDGNEIFINPPQNNKVMSYDGEVLVDFNLSAAEIAEQIAAHKHKLVVVSSEEGVYLHDFIKCEESEVFDIELENTWIDEYGMEYSQDRKRLIKGIESIENYSIEEGTEAIDDYAFDFDGCCGLKEIHLPFGLKVIGSHAFEGCKRLECIELPSTITDKQKYRSPKL